jgi:hypothetical protein
MNEDSSTKIISELKKNISKLEHENFKLGIQFLGQIEERKSYIANFLYSQGKLNVNDALEFCAKSKYGPNANVIEFISNLKNDPIFLDILKEKMKENNVQFDVNECLSDLAQKVQTFDNEK